MASLNSSHRTSARGFSLIELVVVIGLLAIVGGFTIALGFDSYRVSGLQNERKTLTAVLQKARAESLNNIDQSAHGVAIFPPDNTDGYVIFEGLHYGDNHAQDEVVKTAYPVALDTSSPSEIVFGQLSATTTYEGEIKLLDNARSASTTIGINKEGRINW